MNSAMGYTEGSEEVHKEANACPIMKGYWCFDRACGIDHKSQCMMRNPKDKMRNPKDKIYVDGAKVGDYIQQNIAFRRDMEMNYAKALDEVVNLRSELKRKDEEIQELKEALKEVKQILLDYKKHDIPVNINYILERFL